MTVEGKYTDSIDGEVEAQRKAELYKSAIIVIMRKFQRASTHALLCKVNVTKSKMKTLGIDENGNDETTKATHQGQGNTECT